MHADGAMIAVETHVVEGARILRPHDAADGFGHEIRQVDAAGDVADADRKELGAAVIGAPGEQPVIGRMRGGADPEERLAGGERVAVEDRLGGDRRRGARGRSADAARLPGGG